MRHCVIPWQMRLDLRAARMKTLTILGSTGSIGTNTLDVVRRNRHLYQVYALAAGKNVEALASQILEFRPKVAVAGSAAAVERLIKCLSDSGLPRDEWPDIDWRRRPGRDFHSAGSGYGGFRHCRRRGPRSDLRSGVLRQTRRAGQ